MAEEEGHVPAAGSGGSSAWKSRFPVARIKKIMQADEDVGKVAQVTPVAISKALELFMDRIIKAVADETKARGAKKVTPSHFKQIISTQKQYDFLESLTSEIPFPPSRPATPPPQPASATRRRRKQSPEHELSSNHDSAPPKRKRRSPPKENDDEGEVKAENMEEVKKDEVPEVAVAETAEDKHRTRGWFDIVMGSNDTESSEDESYKKRRRPVKDEDEDYVP